MMSRAIFVLADGPALLGTWGRRRSAGTVRGPAQSESGDGAYRAEYDPARRPASPVSTVVLGLRER